MAGWEGTLAFETGKSEHANADPIEHLTGNIRGGGGGWPSSRPVLLDLAVPEPPPRYYGSSHKGNHRNSLQILISLATHTVIVVIACMKGQNSERDSSALF